MTNIDEAQLQHILTTYEGYKKRQRPNYNIEQHSQIVNIPFLQSLLRSAQEQTFLLDKVVNQAEQLYKILFETILGLKDKKFKVEEKLKQAQQQVQKLKDEINTLTKQNKNLIEEKIHEREQFAALGMKASSIEKNCYAEIKELKEERQQLEMKYDNLSNEAVGLKEQNIALNKLLIQQKDEFSELQNKMHQMQKQKQVVQAQMIKLKDQIDWEYKKRQNLQEQIRQKQRNSVHLTEEIESLKEALKHPFDQFDYDIDDLVPFQKHLSREDFAKQKLLLSEDIKVEDGSIDKEAFNHQYELSQNKNESITQQQLMEIDISKATSKVVDNTEGKILDQKSKSVKKFGVIDPYYCHFLLLSQSIKIRQNSQNYFNLDVKPFYYNIIHEKIPMHQWQQWIKEKFDELSNLEKQDKELQSTGQKTFKNTQ